MRYKFGDNVIVGAGSVVTKELKSNAVYEGVPVKFICNTEQLKEKHINSGISFDKYRWDESKNASLEEKEEMYRKCQECNGYVK